MYLSNRGKVFLTVTFFLVLFGACSWTRFGTNANRSSEDQPETELPFSTREPEKYSADVVITIGDSQRIVRTARDGIRRRYDYDHGKKNEFSVILNQQITSMLPFYKVFMTTAADGPDSTVSVPDDPLTVSLLHRKGFAEFEELGTENNITRYSAKLDGSDSARVLIYVDRSIGMPIKQEFYSIENGVEKLRYTVEIRDFRNDADADLFKVPGDYRQVSPSEFQALSKNNK